MKVNASSKRLHWSLKILLWINILNSILLIGAYLNTHISPNSVSYLAFLGLGYPILIIIQGVFILLWVLARWNLVFISVVTILLGWNHFRHFFAITLWQSELENSITVVSYNVHVFDVYDLNNRVTNRNNIFTFLKEQDAEIFCFQEFYHEENSQNFVTRDSLVQLLETPYFQERYTHSMSRSRHFGLATMSKYPIINQGEIGFENDDNNYCIYSDIIVATDTVRVFNAHLGSIRLQSDDYEFFGDHEGGREYLKQEKTGQRILKRIKVAFEKRAVQAEKVASEIERSPYPVIFCGDLNDTPVSYCYRQFISILVDAFVESGNGVGQTYIGKVPSNRIDYIFHDEEMRSSHFTTHQVDFSDHKPISCEISLQH